jgi:hypothetical protein
MRTGVIAAIAVIILGLSVGAVLVGTAPRPSATATNQIQPPPTEGRASTHEPARDQRRGAR